MATHSGILAWRIPWREKPAGYSPQGCKETDMTERLQNDQEDLSEEVTWAETWMERWDDLVPVGQRNFQAETRQCKSPEMGACLLSLEIARRPVRLELHEQGKNGWK